MRHLPGTVICIFPILADVFTTARDVLQTPWFVLSFIAFLMELMKAPTILSDKLHDFQTCEAVGAILGMALHFSQPRHDFHPRCSYSTRNLDTLDQHHRFV